MALESTVPNLVASDTDADGPRARLRKIIDDDGHRALAASFIQLAIDAAHDVRPGGWSVTQPDEETVRVNVGLGFALDARADALMLGLSKNQGPRLPRESEPIILKKLGEDFPLHVLTYEFVAKHRDALRESFRTFCQTAAGRAKATPYRQGHDQNLVEEVAALVESTPRVPAFLEGKPIAVWAVGTPTDLRFDHTSSFSIQLVRSAELPSDGDLVLLVAQTKVHGVGRVESVASPPDALPTVALSVASLSHPQKVEAIFDDDVARAWAGFDLGNGAIENFSNLRAGETLAIGPGAVSVVRANSLGRNAWPSWFTPPPLRPWVAHVASEADLAAMGAGETCAIRWSTYTREASLGDLVFLWARTHGGEIFGIARMTGLAKLADRRASVRLLHRKSSPIFAQELRGDPCLMRLASLLSDKRAVERLRDREAELLLRWYLLGRTPRVVKVAPGENASRWVDCKERGDVAASWSSVGDLMQYENFASFRADFAKREFGSESKNEGAATQKAQELWLFRNLRPGDFIVANNGVRRIVGVGEVTGEYRYETARTDYRHSLPVRWSNVDESSLSEPISLWARRTVYDVPESVRASCGLPFGTRFAQESVRVDGVEPDADANVLAAAKVNPVSSNVAETMSPTPARSFHALLSAMRAEHGLEFDPTLVAHYLLGLQTKRFVILSGISGTGKTQIALGVAAALAEESAPALSDDRPPRTVRKRVFASVHNYRRLVIPTKLVPYLEVEDTGSSRTVKMIVESPGGEAECSCHIAVREEPVSSTSR
jgi:hypothetical protein